MFIKIITGMAKRLKNKIMSYPELPDYYYKEGEKKLPFILKTCDFCDEEFYTQIVLENNCPKCETDFSFYL